MEVSTSTWSKYKERKESFDESFSPIRPSTDSTVPASTTSMSLEGNKSDGGDVNNVAKGSHANLSNLLDGTVMAPPVQLSESTEERKLFGHTLNNTCALARNKLVPRSLSLENLGKVVRDKSLLRQFQTREILWSRLRV